MGMYDNVKCEAPLPDGFSDPAHMAFQTKDMECELAEYTITADGRLLCTAEGQYGGATNGEQEYTGTIEFYTSNWCGSGCGYCMTDDDQLPWSRTYTATFTDGKLVGIEGGLEPQTADVKHVSREEFHRITPSLSREAYRKGALEKHNKAMELAAQAEVENDSREKSILLRDAAMNEGQAANWSTVEPTYSVLTRSAMSLSMSGGDMKGALDRFGVWLQMQRCCGSPPPTEIVAEIVSVLRAIADRVEGQEAAQ